MKFMIKTFCSAKTEMPSMTFEYIILLMINNKNPEIISWKGKFAIQGSKRSWRGKNFIVYQPVLQILSQLAYL